MRLRNIITGILSIIVLVTITACAKGSSELHNDSPQCGDGICEGDENSITCVQDCGSDVCGNTQVETGEECDGTNLDNQTCLTLGYEGGTLSCNGCSFDTSLCEGCPNACTSAGVQRCNGDVIEECQAVGSCLSWTTYTNCANMAQTCDDSGDAPICSSSCSDQCDPQNATRCTGNIIETCTMGGAGCLIWEAGTDCSSLSQVCDEATGTATCADSCSDACPASGDTRCDGETVEECTMGSNGCLGWTTGTDCAAITMVCDSGACVCPPSCTVGDTQCNGDNVELCSTGGDGCAVWAQQEDCTISGLTCDAGACGCPSPVCTLGNTQCSGDSVEVCQAGSNGCEEWAFSQDCTVTGEVCASGACTCVDECTSGQNSCNGTIITDCVMGGDGCWVWQDSATDCATSGLPCVSGACGVLDDYVRTSFTGGYAHVNGTSLGSGDDSYYSAALPAGFDFAFYGVAQGTVWVSTNGWLSFGTDPGTSALSDSSLPNSSAPHQAVYPFWEDLVFDSWDCPSSSPQLYYEVQGSAPNRIFVVDWYQGCTYNMDGSDGVHSFQVRLYETTSVIELLYDCGTWDTPWNSPSATLGMEDDEQTDRWDEITSSQSSCPSSNYRYTPAPH